MSSGNRTLSEIISEFITQQRPAGIILPIETVLAQALAATHYYAGFCQISTENINERTLINHAHWALISPLFLLYLERETALQLEAARGGFGIEPFGRSSSEIVTDITQYEAELPRRAFAFPIINL